MLDNSLKKYLTILTKKKTVCESNATHKKRKPKCSIFMAFTKLQ